jgi:protease I
MANYTESDRLAGLKVAILITDGFEQVEMTEPRKKLDAQRCRDEDRLTEDAARPRVGLHQLGRGVPRRRRPAPCATRQVRRASPARRRAEPRHAADGLRAVDFVRAFFDAGKPVAVICHGPWTIIEADRARGRRMTSWPSLRTDLRNAGAEWVDEPVVVDGDQLVCSRQPDDIPQFNKAWSTSLRSACRRIH